MHKNLLAMLLHTGSIYCDTTLVEGGFCGESLRGTNVVAVKTHNVNLQWKEGNKFKFDKAVFLIRNPFRANIAEWNRQMSGTHSTNQTGSSHVKYITSKAFFGK